MDELIDEFLEETNENLNTLGASLLDLEKKPNSPEILNEVFRNFHTIKGSGGALGFSRLQRLAHAAENVLSKVREGKLTVDTALVSLILKVIDSVKQILDYMAANRAEPTEEFTDLLAQLGKYADLPEQKAASPAPAAAEPAQPSDTPQAEATPKTSAESETASLPEQKAASPTPTAAEPTQPSASPQAEVAPKTSAEGEAPSTAPASGTSAVAATNSNTNSIRVKLSTLEDIMNITGELVLIRNQLLQILKSQADSEFAYPLTRLNKITTSIQETAMKIRMQPIKTAWTKLTRIVRDLSTQLGKQIELKMIGEDTELDRQFWN